MQRTKPKVGLRLIGKEPGTKTEDSEKKSDPDAKPYKRRLSTVSSGSANSLNASYSTLKKRLLKREHSNESSIGVNFKEQGNFYHLPRGESKYAYEYKVRRPDPFSHVDVATDCETFFIGQKARAEFNKTEHFAYIVDLDNYEYHKVVFHSFLNEILQSSFFRYAILVLILINSVLIGLATLPYLKNYEGTFELIDAIILSVFIFEVIIKWIYDFRLFWTVYWNVLDFCIISMTMLAALVPMADQGDQAAIAVRVVRTFRSLRCVSSMTSLSIVTHTVIKSGLDMGNILLVLIIFMLVLSVMAVILFDIEDLSPQRFLNALDAWVVLFICVTQDGWAEVLNSYDRSSRYFFILAVYLIFAVSVGAFVFANLIVAVIVANLELSVKELREEMKIHDNPLDFHGSLLAAEVEIIPVYDVLSKNNFVLISQRPLKIPKLRKLSTRRIQVYISLIVALEQNMLEAEIISIDLEKIIAVILTIIVQIDVNTGKIAEKERKEALEKLAKLAEMAKAAVRNKKKKYDSSSETESAMPDPGPPVPPPEERPKKPKKKAPKGKKGKEKKPKYKVIMHREPGEEDEEEKEITKGPAKTKSKAKKVLGTRSKVSQIKPTAVATTKSKSKKPVGTHPNQEHRKEALNMAPVPKWSVKKRPVRF